MATLRTYEEKAAIVEHCIELEKTGGDILGYLWSENYISPRATWCNFQREWLHRKPYEYTDGKPKNKGEKKMNGMDKIMADRQKRLEDLKNRINDGMGIRAALADMGYTGRSAGQVYRQIKNYAQENDPEAFAMLPEKISDEDTPVRTDAPTLKVDGPLKIETPEGCSGLFHGTKGEKAAAAEKPPVTQPVCYDGMTVREIEGLFGRYRRADINGATYIDFENPDGADILSYTVDQWRKMRVEQANAFRILGVEL